MLQVETLWNLYACLGVNKGGVSLGGRKVEVNGEVLLKVTEGVSVTKQEYHDMEFETVLMRGLVHACVLQGDAVVRAVQKESVAKLAARMKDYGFLKASPIKVGLADEDPTGNRAWKMLVGVKLLFCFCVNFGIDR